MPFSETIGHGKALDSQDSRSALFGGMQTRTTSTHADHVHEGGLSSSPTNSHSDLSSENHALAGSFHSCIYGRTDTKNRALLLATRCAISHIVIGLTAVPP